MTELLEIALRCAGIVLFAAVTYVVIPAIESFRVNKLDAQQRAQLTFWVETAVLWAKQWLQSESGEAKKAQVMAYVNWMHHVDTQQEQDHAWIKRLDEKLDSICADTMDLKIESMREAIISFASYVIEEKNPVTREQFNRIFKRHREYEEIIEAKGLTNGEVDIAIRIINESYEHHMRNHSFVEDVRGYGLE